MSYKVHYFDFPGRAEVARLCLSIGGIPYDDVFYTQATFPEAKPKMPFGQVPVLELPDGKMLAQSGAIERYTAKLAGLYPEDPLKAARADEAVFLMADFMDLFNPAFYLPAEERAKARQEILAGKGKDKLQLLNKHVSNLGEDGYVAGDKLSFADLGIFTSLSAIISGVYDGIPPTLLDDYPALKAFRNKIANEPGVKAYYEKHGEGIRAAFKPDSA
ncbi:hypothetical protein VOLCADRAFT_109826 [Volvox carteri f. nagariensis]|uniref:Glutathione S-transferase n=1 Tax=Volvox carteri f. nagariensis TaxID=3068 RepID=D8U137_VOLCA|nr:uncharacterized protein VOLCADRAFT_109826 [Volvox carteri f. nagariensis]EFJ46564.1 hypothetical protein VOLCADRAFT_109826 [Volvox carteri f. nagariensis]|eukprot:XP_002952421.1 hypothetical protein VOLCADRAFT_109826 [Volvox carteri f. nagariensis]